MSAAKQETQAARSKCNFCKADLAVIQVLTMCCCRVVKHAAPMLHIRMTQNPSAKTRLALAVLSSLKARKCNADTKTIVALTAEIAINRYLSSGSGIGYSSTLSMQHIAIAV